MPTDSLLLIIIMLTNLKKRQGTKVTEAEVLSNLNIRDKAKYFKRGCCFVVTRFHKCYTSSLKDYEVKQINDIVYNEKVVIVAKFKDFLITNDSSEFLKRFYEATEVEEKLLKLLDYYEKYSKIFPNYNILSQAKYIYKNIQKKQRLIDNQQQKEEYYVKSEDSLICLFNSKVRNSILNQSSNSRIKGSKRKEVSSIKGLNKSIEMLIKTISSYESKTQLGRNQQSALNLKYHLNTHSFSITNPSLLKYKNSTFSSAKRLKLSTNKLSLVNPKFFSQSISIKKDSNSPQFKLKTLSKGAEDNVNSRKVFSTQNRAKSLLPLANQKNKDQLVSLKSEFYKQLPSSIIHKDYPKSNRHASSLPSIRESTARKIVNYPTTRNCPKDSIKPFDSSTSKYGCSFNKKEMCRQMKVFSKNEVHAKVKNDLPKSAQDQTNRFRHKKDNCKEIKKRNCLNSSKGQLSNMPESKNARLNSEPYVFNNSSQKVSFKKKPYSLDFNLGKSNFNPKIIYDNNQCLEIKLPPKLQQLRNAQLFDLEYHSSKRSLVYINKRANQRISKCYSSLPKAIEAASLRKAEVEDRTQRYFKLGVSKLTLPKTSTVQTSKTLKTIKNTYSNLLKKQPYFPSEDLKLTELFASIDMKQCEDCKLKTVRSKNQHKSNLGRQKK